MANGTRETHVKHWGRGKGTRLRLAGWLGGGGLVAVAALMLVAPIASATPFSLTFTAPYTGMTKSIGNSLSSYGCSATAAESVAPTFSAHTGIFRFAGATSAATCAGATYNEGILYGDVALGSPHFQVPSSGTYKVGAIWQTTYSASLSVVWHSSGSNASRYSYAEAYVYLEADMYVYDVTNGSYIFGTGVGFLTIANWYLTSTGSIHLSSGPSSNDLTQWVKLAAGHTYAAEITFSAEAFSFVDASPGIHDSASASVNLGTGTDRAFLAHIVVV
jgi:hypothetical protein